MISTFITLRGEELRLEGEMAPAEFDVGIMSAYPDEEYAYREDGSEVDWEWAEDEVSAIEKALTDAYNDDVMEED